MTDAEWANIAREFAESMGLEDQTWVAVRHGEDHIHFVAARVNHEGQVWDAGRDYFRAQKACQSIECEHQLVQAPRRSIKHPAHKVTQAEWQHSQSTGERPPRVELAARVRAVLEYAQGAGREGFEQRCAAAGVLAKPSVAKTGTVSGYRFGLASHVDKAGEQVWFKASQLDRELAWGKVRPVIEGPAPEAPVHTVVPKKTFERAEKHAARQAEVNAVEDREHVAKLAAATPHRAQDAAARVQAWWTHRVSQTRAQRAALAADRENLAAVREAFLISSFGAEKDLQVPRQKTVAERLKERQAERMAERSHLHRTRREPPKRDRGRGR